MHDHGPQREYVYKENKKPRFSRKAMAFITKFLFNNILGRFIHDDFHEAVSSMTITDAFLFLVK